MCMGVLFQMLAPWTLKQNFRISSLAYGTCRSLACRVLWPCPSCSLIHEYTTHIKIYISHRQYSSGKHKRFCMSLEWCTTNYTNQLFLNKHETFQICLICISPHLITVYKVWKCKWIVQCQERWFMQLFPSFGEISNAFAQFFACIFNMLFQA